VPQKTVVIIGGPTASGKTGVAISLAKHLDTEIISADSRQCFKELNIGVARPSSNELSLVPHHFIATHSIHEKVTAATFETYALQKADDLFVHKDVVVMAGGTGLYIRAFCEGLDAIPEVPDAVREEVNALYQKQGLAGLQAQIAKLDAAYYTTGEMQNPQRLMRALEVYKTTGQSIIAFRNGAKASRPFRIIKVALDLPKDVLHQNINARVNAMVQQGLLAEVQSLFLYQNLNALQTVGYKEMFAYLNGDRVFDDAVSAIKQNTRRYAKRQLTWFRKDKSFTWLPAHDIDAIINHVSGQLK
jgi:tRNA dimethylallyltransferase